MTESLERPGTGRSETNAVARNAGTVGIATMLSRVLGLLRDQTMAVLFGAGFATDAFNVAFRIPNLLRDLFAEGAMSSAFVPTFTAVRREQGEAAAWALGRQLMMTLLAMLLGLCVLGWLFTPQLVTLFAGGFAHVPGKLELTISLTRIMLPFLPIVALAAAAMGMLNARNVFFMPALAPALLNVGMIAFGLALIPATRAFGQPAILAMALGVVLGGVLQFACQLPALAKLGFRFRFERPRADTGVRRVAALMVPATIGLAATQVNILVSTVIAASLQQGSVSWLYYAFRLMQLPIGVFGVALATVSLPALSRAAVDRDMGALKRTLSGAVRLVFVLTVPSALFLAVTARPVIALLFEHGRFHAADTLHTADALVMYCVGLPAFAAVGIFTRTFYALGETRVPVQASFVSVGLNIALNLLFIGPLASLGLGHAGLALATSITSVVNLLQLAFYLHRRVGDFEQRRILATLVRVALASTAVVAMLAWGLAQLGERWHQGALSAGLTVAGAAIVGLALAAITFRVARVEELGVLDDLAKGLARRFRR
ncbi:MAG: murein biosynthesis integral membrane protein MurJ [Candidatus Eisenbacteria bacterium]